MTFQAKKCHKYNFYCNHEAKNRKKTLAVRVRYEANLIKKKLKNNLKILKSVD